MSGYFLKVIPKGGKSTFFGKGNYLDLIPQKGQIGPWSKKIKPILCTQGWHACLPHYIHRWMEGMRASDFEVWLVELGGTIRSDENKVAGERIRFIRRVTLREVDKLCKEIQQVQDKFNDKRSIVRKKRDAQIKILYSKMMEEEHALNASRDLASSDLAEKLLKKMVPTSK